MLHSGAWSSAKSYIYIKIVFIFTEILASFH